MRGSDLPPHSRGWPGLFRVLALGLVLLVVFTASCSSAAARSLTDQATDQAPEALATPAPAKGPVVELLRLGVPSVHYRAWLEAEQASWEPWLANQPGFLGRQLLWDRQRQEGTLLIRWATRGQWKAIPETEVGRVQERFEQRARQLTGQATGNPFPLLAEAELEPLASSAKTTISPGPLAPALGG